MGLVRSVVRLRTRFVVRFAAQWSAVLTATPLRYVAHYKRCVAHYKRCVAHYKRCVAHYKRCVAHYKRCVADYERLQAIAKGR